MPYDFHNDRVLYFEHQKATTSNYIIPFIEQIFKITSETKVLEIGCGEGGVLQAFLDRDCDCFGVELNTQKFDMASKMMEESLKNGKLHLINKNIYDDTFKDQFQGKFDLIILKDVIEHIPDQKKLMGYLHTFLQPGGSIFLSFPPWQMPFGGHQQMCKSVLKKTPWFHLLPTFLYKSVLKQFAESENAIKSLMANKETGISIGRFERILKKHKYKILNRTYYLFNPIYKYKFNIEPKEQIPFLTKLPYLRNFITTAMYYLIQK